MGIWDLFLGSNNLEKGLKEYSNTEHALLLDVREPDEYEEGHLKDSVNIPLGELNRAKIDEGRKVFVYCRSGARSQSACQLLRSRGIDAQNIGGLMGYHGALERGNHA